MPFQYPPTVNCIHIEDMGIQNFYLETNVYIYQVSYIKCSLSHFHSKFKTGESYAYVKVSNNNMYKSALLAVHQEVNVVQKNGVAFQSYTCFQNNQPSRFTALK